MKKAVLFFIPILLLSMLSGCKSSVENVDIAATTLPVYEFTSRLCQGTDITVGRLVTESISCLHDYTLQVSQMRMIEEADAIVISGAGLEDFLDDALDASSTVIDASSGTHVHAPDHSHDHDGHRHESDPHIWLSPENAKIMVENICANLTDLYPKYSTVFENNAAVLYEDINHLQAYADETLDQLACRELITFHDGFAYFAEAFDLAIVKAVEEESGSTASASELITLIATVDEYKIPAIFTEENGSTSAARIISAETGADIYTLDMAMAGDSYFDAMYHNINTIKEALG